MRGPLVGALALIVAAGVGLGAWFVLRGGDDVVGETPPAGSPEPQDPPGVRPEPREPRDGGPSPRGTNDTDPRRTRRTPLREPPIPALPEETEPGRSRRFGFGAYAEPAERVDWYRAGIQCRTFQRDLVALARRVEKGADPMLLLHGISNGLVGIASEVQPLNGQTMQRGIDEPALNPMAKVIENPSFESNAIAATLDLWEMPLTDEQTARIGKAFEAYQRTWDESRVDLREGQWRIDDLLELTRGRTEVQRVLDEVLTEDQREALSPPELKDRIGLDLFSPASIWRDRALLAEVPEDEPPARALLPHIGFALKVAAPNSSELEAAVGEWVRTLPPDVVGKGVQGALSRAGYVRLRELLPVAEAWPALMATLQERFPDVRRPRRPGEPVPERQVVLIARVTR